MMRTCINQSSHIKPQSVTALSVYQTAAPSNVAPFDPVISLTWDAAGQSKQAISRPVTSNFYWEGRRAQYLAACTFELPCLPPPLHAPFPCHTWLCGAFFHSCAPIHGIPVCASAVPGHAFSHRSTTMLGCAFVPPSGSGSRPSTEPSLKADIMPHFLMPTFTQGSPTRLKKNK